MDNNRGDNLTPLQTSVEIANDIGISERTYQRQKQLAKDIDIEVKDVIRNEPIAGPTNSSH